MVRHTDANSLQNDVRFVGLASRIISVIRRIVYYPDYTYNWFLCRILPYLGLIIVIR